MENKKDKKLEFSKAQCESFGHKSGIDLWFNDIAGNCYSGDGGDDGCDNTCDNDPGCDVF